MYVWLRLVVSYILLRIIFVLLLEISGGMFEASTVLLPWYPLASPFGSILNAQLAARWLPLAMELSMTCKHNSQYEYHLIEEGKEIHTVLLLWYLINR